MYITNETNHHTHTISNPHSGVTDPAPDGHIHKLNIPGCASCRQARQKLIGAAERIIGRQLYPTEFVKGHLHYFSSDVLR
jgi:hypothetical protein